MLSYMSNLKKKSKKCQSMWWVVNSTLKYLHLLPWKRKPHPCQGTVTAASPFYLQFKESWFPFHSDNFEFADFRFDSFPSIFCFIRQLLAYPVLCFVMKAKVSIFFIKDIKIWNEDTKVKPVFLSDTFVECCKNMKTPIFLIVSSRSPHV